MPLVVFSPCRKARNWDAETNSQELPLRVASVEIEPTRSIFQMEQHMNTLFARFVKDESGATAIEYGLIAALISVAVIAGVRAIGTKLSSTFNGISQNLS